MKAGEFTTSSIRCLNIGKPGVGKSGALIEILIAYPQARMFVANFDGGNFATLPTVARFDPVTKQARDPKLTERLLNEQLFVHNFEDPIKPVNGIPMVVGTPTAFSDVGRKLNDWGDGLGGLDSWGPDDWFVYDSISGFCEAGMRQSLQNAGRLNRRPQIEDWGEAIQRASLLLEMTNATTVKCNIWANTHVRRVGDLEGAMDKNNKPVEIELVPNAIGQQLPQTIGRYFNNMLETRLVGEGMGEQRIIHTRSPGGLTLRSSNPAMVKPTYPINGLGQWVADIRSVPPSPAATPAASTPATPVAPVTSAGN